MMAKEAEDGKLFSVKMRASQEGAHISGAERIVPASALPQLAAVMTTRALDHAKGNPHIIQVLQSFCNISGA